MSTVPAIDWWSRRYQPLHFYRVYHRDLHKPKLHLCVEVGPDGGGKSILVSTGTEGDEDALHKHIPFASLPLPKNKTLLSRFDLSVVFGLKQDEACKSIDFGPIGRTAACELSNAWKAAEVRDAHILEDWEAIDAVIASATAPDPDRAKRREINNPKVKTAIRHHGVSATLFFGAVRSLRKAP